VSQLAIVGTAAALLAGTIVLLVPRREVALPPAARFEVDPLMAAGFFLLLSTEVASPL